MKSFDLFLFEEYILTLKSGDSVFKNPGSSDLIKLRNRRKGTIEIRFLADATKKDVYVWDAFNTSHADAAKALKSFIQGDYFNINLFFTGTASMEGASLYYQNSDMVDSMIHAVKKKNPKTDDRYYLVGKKIMDNKNSYAETYKFADKYVEGISSFFNSL